MNNRFWDLSLSTGVGVIDIQNRRIIDWLNLLDSTQKNGDRDQISLVLTGLQTFVERHFSYEERLMDRAGYPLTQRHTEAHKCFKSIVEDYQNRHDEGEDISQPLLIDLEVWLAEHIQKEDLDFAPYAKITLNEEWFSRLFS
ncbi:MAG: bacteriohemerythrin [Candidatus Polarisedimenticolaceae bacterium]|nr:bacteriohemerythrin [Candidatus Polarisedimenticolaceae bacterium]